MELVGQHRKRFWLGSQYDQRKKKLVCKICGYVYESEALPKAFAAMSANAAPRILKKFN